MHAHPVPRENLFDYTVAFHNDVNVRLGKPEVTPDVARAEFARASCSQACNDPTDASQNQTGVVILYITIMVSTLLIFMFLRNATR
jgi:hypothetical protein